MSVHGHEITVGDCSVLIGTNPVVDSVAGASRKVGSTSMVDGSLFLIRVF